MRRFCLGSVACGAFLIVAVEVAFRITGGLPVVTPGWTPVEYQWRLNRAKVAPAIYFVGDSRVGWGLAESTFESEFDSITGKEIKAVNAGWAAASTENIVNFIFNYCPEKGTMIVNYSPASFYHFHGGPVNKLSNIKLQDYLDDKINTFISSYLFSYSRKDIIDHFRRYFRSGFKKKVYWCSRHVFKDGFVNAELACNDGSAVDLSEYQLDYYKAIISNVAGDHALAEQRRENLVNLLNKCSQSGWNVVLVRFPIGPKMRNIEKEIPDDFSFSKLALRLNAFSHDYNMDPRTSELPTIDESHLLPESALRFSHFLARDISGVLYSQDSAVLRPDSQLGLDGFHKIPAPDGDALGPLALLPPPAPCSIPLALRARIASYPGLPRRTVGTTIPWYCLQPEAESLTSRVLPHRVDRYGEGIKVATLPFCRSRYEQLHNLPQARHFKERFPDYVPASQ